MPYYAVVDTNVIVSALLTKNFDSATVKVMSAVFSGDIIPVFHDKIIHEYNKVLHRAKFKLKLPIILKVLYAIMIYRIKVYPVYTNGVFVDPSDRIFYESALAVNAYLITGNQKHYPNSEFVVSPAEMVRILNYDIEP